MAGEDTDVRRKHHRSTDDGVSEGSNRRKHKHEDLVSHPPPPVLVFSSPNSRPEEDTEEVEILAAAADVNLKKKKKKGDSDAESTPFYNRYNDVKSYSDTNDRGKNLKRYVFRYVDEQDDYEERVELKPAQQEEEESRKRRQAILEKYKHQQSQQVKTDVVVGPAQPSSSYSTFQFGSFEPMTLNPPKAKQQPHPSIPSHSMPIIKGLQPKSQQNLSKPPRSYLTLIVQWGKGVRSTNQELVEGVDPVFTVHTLGGHNVPMPPGIQLFPFDATFGRNSLRASQAIYHCRNIRQNNIHMRVHDREQVHNYSFWNAGWQHHRHQCGMHQDHYYDFILREFREINRTLYPAFMASCGDPVDGKSQFNVDLFLEHLDEADLYPSVHVSDTNFSVNQEEPELHQELVELKFYLSLTRPRVSYYFPTRSNYNDAEYIYVTM